MHQSCIHKIWKDHNIERTGYSWDTTTTTNNNNNNNNNNIGLNDGV